MAHSIFPLGSVGFRVTLILLLNSWNKEIWVPTTCQAHEDIYESEKIVECNTFRKVVIPYEIINKNGVIVLVGEEESSEDVSQQTNIPILKLHSPLFLLKVHSGLGILFLKGFSSN